MNTLQGRVCVVTGGGQGLGAAVSQRFAAEEGSVIVVDRNAQTGMALVAALRETGLEAAFEAGDVSDSTQVDDVFARILDRHGKVDVLVNNAGVIRDNLIENITDADWHTVIDVNLFGAFLCARAVFPGMKARGFGRIISFASMSWHGNFGQANYVSAKAGVVGLTRALALEGARHGITANAVSPGLIDTPMLASMDGAARDRFIARIPARRVGTPDEIAEAVTFLASPSTGYITGVVIDVDGGISIGSSIR